MEDLNIKHKTITFLDITQEKNLSDLGFGSDFYNTSLKAQSMKEKQMWDFPEIENFCSVKDIVKRMERLGENICKTYI